MGWTISVGKAGAANGRAQTLSLQFNADGVALQLKVRENGNRPPNTMPAWQAQRVWQKVLSTVVGFD